ncbi:MAG: YIP1 family protein, partial [Candidatus Methanoperedens sp.]
LSQFIPYSGLALFFKYILSALLFAIFMHLAVRLMKGKGSFNNTLKVICYSEAPLNFAWIFYVLMMFASDMEYFEIAKLFVVLWIASNFYVYYIILAGISVTSGITMPRAFAALMVQLFMFAVIIAVFVSGIYLYGTNTHSGSTSEPYNIKNYEKYNTTVYASSAPQIDGIVDEKDRWYEGESFHIEGKKYYTITTKHDFENIYILVQWYAPPEWKDDIAIYFEQDGSSPDFNLKNGRTDHYYQGHFKYGPNSFRDAHYDSGYTVSETQNGNLKGSYKDGVWNLEWQIPLSSGDVHDIYITNYPTQIGFTIINRMGWDSWPPNSLPEKPETWGDMTIVAEKTKE